MSFSSAAWLAATLQTRVLAIPAPPEPQPAPSPGDFDWKLIHPNGAAVPKSELIYGLLNGAMFLGYASVFAGLVCGAIAFGVGPIFGAHMISDRGKSMMWRAALIAILLGSSTAILSQLIMTAQAN